MRGSVQARLSNRRTRMESSTQAAASGLELDGGYQGQQFRPGDEGYDAARAIYNAMIDKRPALIARPAGTADVVDAVNLAREKGLPVAVRCGGHGVAGTAACDDGLLIDLRGMKGVHVDQKRKVARAWRDWVEQGPGSVCAALGILLAPPEPFVPPEVQGTPVLGILAMYAGDAGEGAEVLRPLKEDIGPPVIDLIDRIPYTAFQA